MPHRKSSIHEPRRELSLAIDDGTQTGTFLAIARLRATRLTLGRARPVRANLEGVAVLCDEQGDICLQRLFLDGTIVCWRIRAPRLCTLEGPFRITRLHSRNASEFELALDSAGPIAFEASATFAGERDATFW